jgi:hypothetical protein
MINFRNIQRTINWKYFFQVLINDFKQSLKVQLPHILYFCNVTFPPTLSTYVFGNVFKILLMNSPIFLYPCVPLGQSMIGVSHLTNKERFLKFPNLPCSSQNLWLILNFPLLFHVKWNKIPPNIIYASKISIIFTYESKNNKMYPMWTMFY